MPFIEILEVSLHKPTHERLHGCYLDAPRVGLREEADRVDVVGWALEKDGPAAGVEVFSGERLVRRVAMNRPRPDLASAFPGIPGADRAGFQTQVGLHGMSGLDWTVRAVLRDETRVPI